MAWLPTTANYIIVASLMAPVIVEWAPSRTDRSLIAVHLFVFYFGIWPTPYLRGSLPLPSSDLRRSLRTGVQAFYYSARTVVLPFIFIFNYQL